MRTFAKKPKATRQAMSAKTTVPARSHLGHNHEVNSILHLQRTIGNQAVQRLLQSNAEERNTIVTGTTSPHFGYDFSRIPIHPPAAGAIQMKLAINTPGDEYEQEADRIADQVMRMPEPKRQRACACGGACPKCQTESQAHARQSLQSKHIKSGALGLTEAPPSVLDVFRSPGHPLDTATRAFMEPRFGHDFSGVRVHSNPIAEQAARQINARAYTVGQSIAFGSGQFAPSTHDGRRLLAHELAHVVQQHGGNVADTVQCQQAPPATPATPATPAPPVCPVTPIPIITDADALAMEGGARVIWNNTAAGLQAAANNLVGLIEAAGGTAIITSAHRPQAYQDHLRAVWDRARDLQNQPQPGPCDAVRATVNAEMANHQLNVNRPVGQTSNHTGGNAVDIDWTLPAALTPAICQLPAVPSGAPAPPLSEEQCIDNLASQAGLSHPLHARDRPHFQI